MFDYARIRTVVEDRHSALGAFVAGARFVRRHPATLRLYLINGAGFILLALVYALVAPGAPSGLAIWIALALGQLYILLRHYVKLLFYASQVAYFQGSPRPRRLHRRPAGRLARVTRRRVDRERVDKTGDQGSGIGLAQELAGVQKPKSVVGPTPRSLPIARIR